MNYKEIEMEGMKEILRDKEEEIKKLKNIILKLGTRIYQNIDGEKRKEYQEYCKRNKL